MAKEVEMMAEEEEEEVPQDSTPARWPELNFEECKKGVDVHSRFWPSSPNGMMFPGSEC